MTRDLCIIDMLLLSWYRWSRIRYLYLCFTKKKVLGQDEFVLDLLELLSNVATMKKLLLTTYIAYCLRIKRHCQKT
jgi:hypothetical protein